MTTTSAMPMGAQMTAEHATLQRFEGTWRAEVKFWMDAEAPPMISRGTMHNKRVLGGLFLAQEYSDDAKMFAGYGYWGYNTTDRCFEGFWIDVAATFFQLQRGQHDPGSDTYTMTGEMKHPGTGALFQKRTAIRVLGPSEHRMESYFRGPDGSERKVMEIRYTRAPSDMT